VGHGVTLFAFGLPVVVFGSLLPAWVHTAAEVAIGALIVWLAGRLLVRWRRGHFHTHPHRHGSLRHAHPHVHETGGRREHKHGDGHEHAADHEHAHPEERLGRSPAAAFGIGLVHGVGGSAGVGILLVGAISREVEAIAALLLFAGATAISMALFATGFGVVLGRGRVIHRLRRIVPVLGTVSLVFGAWYALGALEVVPYLF
jgi:ABC-type nickel/cobalt efflux system permease component RcnA